MQAAEGVPQREDRVDGTLRVIDLQIVGTIAAVGIAIEVRGDHAVVKSRIEHRLVRLVGVGHLVTLQFLVPLVVGLLFQGIEVEVVFSELSFQVFFGAFHIDGRNSNTHDDLLAFFGIEIEISLDAVSFYSIGFHTIDIQDIRQIKEGVILK